MFYAQFYMFHVSMAARPLPQINESNVTARHGVQNDVAAAMMRGTVLKGG
jgi:hypothetical protein